MPTTTVLDIIDGARVREVKGNVIEVTRAAIMEITADAEPFTTDEVLFAALASDDLPTPGAEHPHDPELFLEDRIPRPIGGGIVRIELIYRRPVGGGFDTPPQFPFVISGDSSVQQIETAVDRNGEQITVTHEGKTQGGLIHPFEIVEELHLEEVIGTADPTLTARFYTNTLNTDSFFFDLSAAPRTWLFARVGYELVQADALPFPLWRMTYELRKNPDGFDPQVVFIDPEEGKPPPGLVAGEGFKTIPWHFDVSWRPLFGP